MLKVLLRMDFLRFTREYMSMFSWKNRAFVTYCIFTLDYQTVSRTSSGLCITAEVCSPPQCLQSTCEVAPPHGSVWCCWCCPSPEGQPQQCCTSAHTHTRTKCDNLKVPLHRCNISKQLMSHRCIQYLQCLQCSLRQWHSYIASLLQSMESEKTEWLCYSGTVLTFISNLRVFTFILNEQVCRTWLQHCSKIGGTGYKYCHCPNTLITDCAVLKEADVDNMATKPYFSHVQRNPISYVQRWIKYAPINSLLVDEILQRKVSVVWLLATCWPVGQTAGSDWGVQIGSSSPGSSSSAPHGHSCESDLPLHSPHSGDSYGL